MTKSKVGAKPKYKKQPKQMNVRFVEAKDHRKIKELERELLNQHKVK
jgi:hypothetical protein